MTDVVAIRRALVSVYDKAGVTDLAKGLHDAGVELISTGSTAARIADAGVPVTAVEDVTGFPECLDGRVKTLHPHVHAGLLADRRNSAHVDELERLGVTPIDLVVVNLYPFQDAVASGAADDDVIEMIDIGGPTMLRAAAKNHASVGIVVDPRDYDALLTHLRDDGGLPAASRRELAAKAFAHVATYDAAIADWFHRDDPLPPRRTYAFERRQVLRYGENPHQQAVFYADSLGPARGLAGAEQLGGKELSYNNLVDTDAAVALVADLDGPAVAIIKHTNPAGVAVAEDLVTAYDRALAGDPVSAFGGIVAANRTVDRATAERIVDIFTEVVAAPGYDDGALEVLTTKKNLRILRVPDAAEPHGGHTVRSVSGGLLVQDADTAPEVYDDWRTGGAVEPDDATLADLRFAWTVAKHVKSNAIVLVKDQALVGCGAGQMSRVDSVRLAVEKSQGRAEGSVLASDAFFPFRDGPDAAAAAGIRAIVQPGGSVRDDEVTAAADEHGIAMVLTGRRHFRH
jgi:phosphoribosylaminoimidazolecarboxamide formyltransferase / IMP cyclohydrolase